MKILGLELWEIVVWIAVIIITIGAIIMEQTQSKCYNDPAFCFGIYDIRPKPNDTPADLVKRIEYANRLHTEHGYWRRSWIAAVIITFLLFFALKQRFPRTKEALITIIVVVLVIYLMILHFQSHVLRPRSKGVEPTIEKLKVDLGISNDAPNVPGIREWV